MLIIRKCPLTGVQNKREIDVTEGQLKLWHEGALIQIAMPHLTPDEREFVMSGITPEEWAETFGEE